MSFTSTAFLRSSRILFRSFGAAAIAFAGLTSPAHAEEQEILNVSYDIARELYLSMLVDRATGKIAFVASTEGGMDIEEVAHATRKKS